MLELVIDGLYIHVGSIGIKSCLAGFDLGNTIIKTIKSGETWQWEFLPNSLFILKQYQDSGYTIVIFSNQNYEGHDLNLAMKRNYDVISALEAENINPWVLIATERNIYRKPGIGMWEIFKYYYNEAITLINNNYYLLYIPYTPLSRLIDINLSFFTGDSAGRKHDTSSNDKNFAANIGLKFYTPEEMFFFRPNNQEFILS